jgi:hypothetical protein
MQYQNVFTQPQWCGTGFFHPGSQILGEKKHRISDPDPKQRIKVFSTPKNVIMLWEI